jgi:hypothetical protein
MKTITFKLLVASLPLAAIIEATQKYLFSDFEFLIWLTIAMIVDLITGITKVWVKKGMSAITSEGLRKTVAKLIQYGMFLIITNVLVNFTVKGEAISPLAFIGDWSFILLIMIEIKSVYENIIEMRPGLDFVKKIITSISQIIKSKPNA